MDLLSVQSMHRNLPGPGTGIVKTNKEGEVTGKYTAWNQIPYEPPIKKIPVNYYGEPVVQKQPVPTTKNRKQLEEEEEKGRHNLYSSVSSAIKQLAVAL